MTKRASLLLFAAIAVLACVSTSVHAKTTKSKNKDYDLCSKNSDCRDSKKPICAMVYIDSTAVYAGIGNAKAFGVCVQCTQNCQCSPNQYCKPEIKVSDVLDNNAISNLATKLETSKFQADYFSVKDLQMPSKCEKISKAETFRKGDTCNAYINPFVAGSSSAMDVSTNKFKLAYDNGQDANGGNANVEVNIEAYSDSRTSLATNGSDCSIVTNRQPAFAVCSGGQCDSRANSFRYFNGQITTVGTLNSQIEVWKSGFGDAGQCTNTSSSIPSGLTTPVTTPFVCGASLCAGQGCGYLQTAGTNIPVQLTGWNLWTNDLPYVGWCESGKCKTCLSGTARCSANTAYDSSSGSGSPNSGSQGQICIRNEWRERWFSDNTYRTVDANVVGETTSVTAVFCALTFGLVLAYMLKDCCSAMRNNKKARNDAFLKNEAPSGNYTPPPSAPAAAAAPEVSAQTSARVASKFS